MPEYLRLAVEGTACDGSGSAVRRWRYHALPRKGAPVPRYFFDIKYPSSPPDADGTEFSDIYAAQAAAVRLCGEVIRDIEAKFWDHPVWRLEVKSHDRRLLFTLTFSAEEHEAPA
jgi:hypothetical protein